MNDKTRVFNQDCMEGMKQFPDKYFDLAIVDPPYGIGANKMQLGNGHKKVFRGNQDWDLDSPEFEYFVELKRISKNQIIWGANYMTDHLPPSPCWIVWSKNNGDSSFADAELAWSSFISPVRLKEIHWCGSAPLHETGANKIHPTQKPIKLYKWLLKNYAKEGDKILDSHVGSGSSRIAAYDGGFEYIGYELDTDYFNAQEKRFAQHKSQLKLFV